MTERWQERRIEDELLKRELFLRLRAEHYGVPGGGEPATDQFRRRVRRLLLRHPLFALKLYFQLIDLGLGRAECLGAHRRRRLVRRPRLASGSRTSQAAGAAGLAALRRSRSFAAAVAEELRRVGGLFVAGVAGVAQASGAVVADLATEGRHYRTSLRAGAARVVRTWSERLVQLQRTCRSGVAGLVGSWRLLVSRASSAARVPVPHRIRRPSRGVLAGAVVAALAVSAVVVARNAGPQAESGAAGAGALRSTGQTWHGFFHLRFDGRSRTDASSKPRATKHVGHAPARTSRRSQPTLTQRMTLVSNTVQAASVPPPPAATTTSAPRHDTGPSPLRAPRGGSGPSPLKAP